MKWLNYNHLYYFWMVAREGSVIGASQELMVSQPTVSIQLKELETSLGHRLFDRVGRKLILTDSGKIAFNYANDIFSLGQELVNALEHQPAGRPLRLAVGVVDVIPKPVARRLLEPAMRLPPASCTWTTIAGDIAAALLVVVGGPVVTTSLFAAPMATANGSELIVRALPFAVTVKVIV